MRGNHHSFISLHYTPQEWIMDSGASHDMASSKESLYSLQVYPGPPILMGYNYVVEVARKVSEQFKDGSFENVIHILRVFVNLLSAY